eukprot:TRINITY_DN37933_c0_g1_i1.p1 TRINITY_DN37933_c0_g1~~TRINITY_DN37933_c0_g1_i1.p1  ORF type:complete len:342 (+),score=70.14 TRINITY_DN37933_c0_g1_i1:64-1026(+)
MFLKASLAGAKVSSLDSGTEGGITAIGYENGVVEVKGIHNNELVTVLSANFGIGPCWVGMDESEAVIWVAVVDGRILSLNLTDAGEIGDEFKQVGKHEAEIMSATFNKERGYFVTADSKGDIAVWNTKTDVSQPRRVFSAPESEPWHVLSTSGGHIAAARHNPEVFIFNLSGESHEVRTLTNSEVNNRQIRSIHCTQTSYCVGFHDGSIQIIDFIENSSANAFRKSDWSENLRAIVHKNGKQRYPVSSLTREPGSENPIISCGPDGLYATSMADPSAPVSENILKGAFTNVAATQKYLLATTNSSIVYLPWDRMLSAQAP